MTQQPLLEAETFNRKLSSTAAQRHPAIVLDKSFLYGASRKVIHELAGTGRLLMSEALLFELLSNPQDYRVCFSKFPPIENPVDIVLHVGGYLKKEIETRRPSPKPSDRRRRVRFQFNPLLLDRDYALPEEAANEILRQRNELLGDVMTLKEKAIGIPDFFSDLSVGNDDVRRQRRKEAEELIAEPGSLMEFYAGLRAPKGTRKFPSRRIVNEKWAIYRWLQVQFLFALDLYLRYGFALADPMSPATEERIEHDVLDAQYLFIGVLEGAFATEEKKLQRWFKLLQPSGLLLTKNGLAS